MKALCEEIEIQKILNAAKSIGLKVPCLFEINFYTSGYSLGCANLQQVNIVANYPGEMSTSNLQFVETVVHELVHYNGIMHHKIKFWNLLGYYLEKIQNKLKEEQNNVANNENSTKSEVV